MVVHGGRLIESGTHADLMALGGTYKEMFDLPGPPPPPPRSAPTRPLADLAASHGVG